MTNTTPDIKVPWGTTSNLGILGSLSGVLVVLLTVIFKMDNDDAIAVAGAILTLVSFGLTLWGRYAQAKQIAATQALDASIVASSESFNMSHEQRDPSDLTGS